MPGTARGTNEPTAARSVVVANAAYARRVRRSGVKTGIGLAVGLFLLSGCATPGFNPGRIQSELVRAGVTPAQAKCVTDGLADKFDLKELGSHSPPNAITSPSSTTTSATAAPTTTTTTTTTVGGSGSTAATSSTTVAKLVDEYKVTRDILKQCGVTVPVEPLP